MTQREESKKYAEEKRPKRVPLHEQRDKLGTPQRPGYMRRWVNEIDKFGDRIERLKLAGWKVVSDAVAVGDPSVINGNQSLGSGARKYMGRDTWAVLMEISLEFYEEDQKAKQVAVDLAEDTIERNLKERSQEGVYGNGVYGQSNIRRQKD